MRAPTMTMRMAERTTMMNDMVMSMLVLMLAGTVDVDGADDVADGDAWWRTR